MSERPTDKELVSLKSLGGVVEAMAEELLERRGLVRPICNAVFTTRVQFGGGEPTMHTLACNLGRDHEGPHGVIER